MSTIYLIAYNGISAAAWIYIAAVALMEYTGSGVDGVWAKVEEPLKWVQTAAFLEVVHAIVGLVKSGPGMTFAQVAARNVHVWLMMLLTPTYQTDYWMVVLLTVWALADAPRYLLYVVKLAGIEGSIFGTILNLVRYNFFLVLYPAGLCLELYLQYSYREAAIAAGGEGYWLEPSVGVPVWATAVCIGFFPLYAHMLKQRKKYNQKSNAKKE